MQEAKEKFEQEGLGLVALSYDSQEILTDFSSRHGITYPLLADPDSEFLEKLGLVNPQAEGMAAGVAFPGVLWLDRQGKLKEKFFEESYRSRLTAETLLSRMFPELVMEGEPAEAAGGLKFLTEVAGDELILGSETDLLLQIEIPEGSHLYGPGAKGYTPVELVLESHPWLEFGEVVLPEPWEFELEAIGESAPVYEGRLLLRVPARVVAQEASKLEETREFSLVGTLNYQICTETMCLLPTTEKVEWTVRVLPFDRVRAPEELQHR